MKDNLCCGNLLIGYIGTTIKPNADINFRFNEIYIRVIITFKKLRTKWN